MQQINNLSCAVFIIAYATNIAFGIGPHKPNYTLSQMRLHFQNNINNINVFFLPKILEPKYQHQSYPNNNTLTILNQKKNTFIYNNKNQHYLVLPFSNVKRRPNLPNTHLPSFIYKLVITKL
jgi:hypothetical protein